KREKKPARMSLARSTATITAWNAVSRVTGFVRVLAVGAALGTTFLGNTYQSSNLVSNILFELLAAGLLAAPLVPAFVGLLDRRLPGVHLRPGAVDRSASLLRDVVHVGLWSGAILAANELLIAVTLVRANRVEGGVIA